MTNRPTSIDELRQLARERILRAVGAARTVALVGFPDHSNVGDSAIWQGERSLLRTESIRVSYSCSFDSYRPFNLRRHTDTDTPVLIHGGGYFGDVWPNGLDFILDVISAFHDRRIVLLPQTMQFESDTQLERARRCIGGHPATILCLRDKRSLVAASRAFDAHTELVPDSAIWLDLPKADPKGDILYIARQDREAPRDQGLGRVKGARVTDWVSPPTPGLAARASLSALHRTKRRLHARVARSGSLAWQEWSAASVRNTLAAARLQRGVRLLESASVVVSDRLHAHILSTLLGIPHVLLDNSYGKVRSYYETWSSHLPGVHWASSPGNALAIAKELCAKGSD